MEVKGSAKKRGTKALSEEHSLDYRVKPYQEERERGKEGTDK